MLLTPSMPREFDAMTKYYCPLTALLRDRHGLRLRMGTMAYTRAYENECGCFTAYGFKEAMRACDCATVWLAEMFVPHQQEPPTYDADLQCYRAWRVDVIAIVPLVKHPDVHWFANEHAVEAINLNPLLIRFVERQTTELCMLAVMADLSALQHVVNPTPGMCMAAVQHDGLALRYIAHQTPDMCLRAVQNTPDAVRYAHYITPPMLAIVHAHQTNKSAGDAPAMTDE